MKVLVLAGDGVGPEVTKEAVKALTSIKCNGIDLIEGHIGTRAWTTHGNVFPRETRKVLKEVDAVMLGSVGKNTLQDPEWIKPERALLEMRKTLNCFMNIRPIKSFKSTKNIYLNRCKGSFDILIVRELLGGIYFGKPRGIRKAYVSQAFKSLEGFCTSRYNLHEIESIAGISFELALKRKRKVMLVDKANVLETSKIWRLISSNLKENYRNVHLSYSLIDSAPLEIFNSPNSYDVVLTENLFGDVISDYLSLLTGSIGMLPSASLCFSKVGLYEPVHGSAPSIAHKGLANPIGSVLSAAMLLRYSLNLGREALKIERAVSQVLRRGYKTLDISRNGKHVSTSELGSVICSQIF
jgi:3-isopropylmalate dehydrogenase